MQSPGDIFKIDEDAAELDDGRAAAFHNILESPYLSKRADNTGVLKWCIDGWFVAHPNVRQGWKDKKYELYDCQFVLIRVDVLIPSILWT